MKIVMPGGSGQVGQMLARHYQAAGHDVTVLSRHPASAPWKVELWDGRTAGEWAHTLEGSDVCINLAGRSVNCRYTAANRKLIYDSRIESTRVLNEVIASLHQPPRVWLNASTATIYRHALDRPMDEATGEYGGDEPGARRSWNNSVSVGKAWEEALFTPETPRTRKVALRSSVIMSPDRGGVFDVMLSLVRHGLGGTNGSGKQYVSWIHDVDFIRALDFLIERDDLSGPVNLASPEPLPNREFMRTMREAGDTRIGLPATEWMIELGTLLMGTESELVLKSRWVVPGRLLDAGFRFEFPKWKPAVRDLVLRWRHEAGQPS